MSEASLQASYLLHYTPWRDTSFIVDLFTLEHGRIGLMARGARSAKPRTRALYQPFRPLLVSWFGDGELHTLTGIEESGSVVPLEGVALASAYYLNELVLRLLGKEQPQPELFAHYGLALVQLSSAEAGDSAEIESVLRTFELQLLETIGVLPDLAYCTSNSAVIRAERDYRFHPNAAIAVPLPDARRDHNDLSIGAKVNAIAEHDVHPDGVTLDEGVDVSGRTLLDMAALDFSRAQTREEAKVLMRRLVAGQLGGKPLRSRSMFEALVPPKPAPSAVGAAKTLDHDDRVVVANADDAEEDRGKNERADETGGKIGQEP